MVIAYPPPTDLQVTAASGPASGTVGEPVTLTWTVTNTGNNPAIGPWSDAVYFGSSTTWNISDPFVGTVQFHRHALLQPGQSYTPDVDGQRPVADAGAVFITSSSAPTSSIRSTRTIPLEQHHGVGRRGQPVGRAAGARRTAADDTQQRRRRAVSGPGPGRPDVEGDGQRRGRDGDAAGFRVGRRGADDHAVRRVQQWRARPRSDRRHPVDPAGAVLHPGRRLHDAQLERAVDGRGPTCAVDHHGHQHRHRRQLRIRHHDHQRRRIQSQRGRQAGSAGLRRDRAGPERFRQRHQDRRRIRRRRFPTPSRSGCRPQARSR